MDPGKTTGWATGIFLRASIFENERADDLIPDGIIELEMGQVTGDENGQVDKLIEIVDQFHPDALIIEDFELRKLLKSRDLLSPVRVGHKLDYAIHAKRFNISAGYDGPRIEWQLPALAMTTATDDRLKLWGLYVPGKEHARDGERHVVTFARRMKTDASLRAKFV